MSKEFGIRLYSLRKHKTNYVHGDIARLIGVERSTYTKYETGVAEPPLCTLRKLKEIFDVSYDELLDSQLSEAEITDYEFSRHKRNCRG